MIEMVLPQFGMGMADGTITVWHKAVGDVIRHGEPLCDVEAAKTTVEVSAPCDGVLLQIIVPTGTNVPVNSVIAVIGAADEGLATVALATTPLAEPANGPRPVPIAAPAPAAATQPDRPGKSPQIEPRARRAASKRGLDLASIIGSGPGGRIIEEDVLRAAALPVSLADSAPTQSAPAHSSSRPQPVEGAFATWRMTCDGQPLTNLLEAIAASTGPAIPLQSVLIKAVALALADAGLAAWPVQVRTNENALLSLSDPARLGASAIEAALGPADAAAPCLVIEPLAVDGLDYARFDPACAASLSAGLSPDGALALTLVLVGAAMPPATTKVFMTCLRSRLESPLAALA